MSRERPKRSGRRDGDPAARPEQPTVRQAEVLALVADGRSNKEIASSLGVGEADIKAIVSRLLVRLHKDNRAALAQAALALDLTGGFDVTHNELISLIREAPVMIALFRGSDHRFVFVNRAYVEGGGERDYVGRTFREVFPDLPAVASSLDAVYLTGEPTVSHSVRVTFDRGAGPEERYFDISRAPVRDHTGQVTGVASRAIDITDQMTEQLKMRREANEHAAILDQLPVGVALVHGSGEWYWENREARRIRTVLVGDGALTTSTAHVRDALTDKVVAPDRGVVARAVRGEADAAADVLITPIEGNTSVTLRLRLRAHALQGTAGEIGSVAMTLVEIPIGERRAASRRVAEAPVNAA